ncbi:YdcF family protein [bacterium]|nr:MAG: YdcF family protein [bacterium]
MFAGIEEVCVGDVDSRAALVIVLGAALHWEHDTGDTGGGGGGGREGSGHGAYGASRDEGLSERRLVGAAYRRAESAARLYRRLSREGREVTVIASGGRAWHGVQEATAIAAVLRAHGVPEARVVRELTSLSTRENARFTREMLARRGERDAACFVVTCGFHLARAARASRA